MKKNEYVTPEMEIVEIAGLCNILAGSPEEESPGGGQDEGGAGSKDF